MYVESLYLTHRLNWKLNPHKLRNPFYYTTPATHFVIGSKKPKHSFSYSYSASSYGCSLICSKTANPCCYLFIGGG